MLNRSGESETLCLLVTNIRGKAFSFSPLSMLAVGLSYVAILSKIYYFYTQFESFEHEKISSNFVKCFSYIYLDDHTIFIIHFVNTVYHIY